MGDRAISDNHSHWWNFPKLGAAEIVCAICKLAIPLSDLEGRPLSMHPEIRTTGQTLRILQEQVDLAIARMRR